MSVELLNMLVILTCTEPLEIVFNFVALSILANFDKMLYEASGSNSLKRLFYEEIRDQLLIIEHTTSKRCKDDVMSGEYDEN
jgi:hypothetical protein